MHGNVVLCEVFFDACRTPICQGADFHSTGEVLIYFGNGGAGFGLLAATAVMSLVVSMNNPRTVERTVLLARRRQIDPIGFHFEPAKQPELHLVPIVARRCRPGITVALPAR